MKAYRPLLSLLATLGTAAFLLSCDGRQDATSSEPGVWIQPRFADGTTVPASTVTVVGKLASTGRPDTTVFAAYTSGGTIEFGTLPARTAFRLTLTGLDSAGTPLWWSYADDTAGASPVKDVLMRLSSVPSAAGSLLPAGSTWFLGDTLPVPAGAVYTVDGSDPRSSGNAFTVLDPAGLAVDSNSMVKVAVRTPADPVLGAPELWSPVETYAFGIDVLDTITSLDTLFLSHFDSWGKLRSDAGYSQDSSISGIVNKGILTGPFDPAQLARVDTLPSDLFDATGATLHVYLRLSSARAVASFQGRTVPPDSFVEIPLPADSTIHVTVENHGRTRAYSIRLVKGWVSVPVKTLQGLSASVDGLVSSGNTWLITLPASMDTLSIVPSFPASLWLRIGDTLRRTGETIALSIPRDTLISMTVIDSPGDPRPAGPYNLQVLHEAATNLFRDTAWGIPWRAVDYSDTLLDARNGKKYRTIVVGHARWMAENLNYRRDSTFCPSNMTDSCSKYGRFYRWAAAADTSAHFDSIGLTLSDPWKGACPSGWHLPTQDEWTTLVGLVGTTKSATLLRSTGDVWAQGGGMDSVGFRALPVGRRYIDRGTSVFYGTDGKSQKAQFWTATQSTLNSSQATAVVLNGSATAVDFVSTTLKSDALSVRCIDDVPVP